MRKVIYKIVGLCMSLGLWGQALYSANMILLWDGAAAGPGTVGGVTWTVISASGGILYQKFPVGYNTVGSTGNGTHAHWYLDSLGNASVTTTTSLNRSTTGNNATLADAGTGHRHLLGTGALSSYTAPLPAYRDFVIIRANVESPTTLPAGVIAVFDATPPAGWTALGTAAGSGNDGKFVRGGASYVAAGVAAALSHQHTISITNSATAEYGVKYDAGTAYYTYWQAHNHPINVTLNAATANDPPNITVILAKRNSDGGIPINMIAMFDAIPAVADWSVVSNACGAFYQRTIKPTGAYGTTYAGAAHTHTVPAATTASFTDTKGIVVGASTASTVQTVASGAGHTHPITIRPDVSQDQPAVPWRYFPPYYTVIFAKALNAFAIELVGFDAIADNGFIRLQWEVEAEIDSKEYIVQRRSKGQEEYKEIVRIPATGTACPKSYEYKDNNVISGTEYEYRLGELGNNNEIKWYASVKVVARSGLPKKLALNVFPSVGKVGDRFNITYEVPSFGKPIHLAVYNSAGQGVKTLIDKKLSAGVYHTEWNGKNGNNEQVPVGNYFCVLRVDGKEVNKIIVIE